MFRRMQVFFAALALLLVHAGSSAQAQKLRLGVEGAYPPFSEIGSDGKLKGFEIELAAAFCAQMKVSCELVKIDFDGLIREVVIEIR